MQDLFNLYLFIRYSDDALLEGDILSLPDVSDDEEYDSNHTDNNGQVRAVVYNYWFHNFILLY